MKRRVEEYHGLSQAEAAEMDAMNVSRVEWERLRTMRAHGDLCASLIHARSAEAWFQRVNADVAVRIANAAAKLSELIPDYGEIIKAQKASR